MSSPLHDTPYRHTVLTSETLHQGRVFDLLSERVDLGGDAVVTREFVKHPGAVAIVALDAEENVVLIRQYRHPVRSRLWEVPAGLLDIPGEPLVDAARRELAEEVDLIADSWHTLVDFYTSPGASDEALRIFLARDLQPVPEGERHQRQEEERDMEIARIPLAEAAAAVLAGAIHNPSAVAGVLAAHAARDADWTPLRPAGAPWVR